MYKYTVTILTTTYNRRHTLPALYESLCRQTEQNFQWLIIDDGSSDDTEEYIRSLAGHQYELDYVYKENGGKHTALNKSHEFIKGELTAVVDSDDYLVDNAVETIIKDWNKYQIDPKIGGLCYARKHADGVYISSMIDGPVITDYITLVNNQRKGGDRCEIYRTDIFNQFSLPVFPNERFMSEGWLHRHIAYDYNLVYFNDALVICEYMPDGYTKAGRKMLMNNPYGLMENCRSCFHPKVNAKMQLKEMILFGVYGLCANMNWFAIARYSGRPVRLFLCMPVSTIFYKKWK